MALKKSQRSLRAWTKQKWGTKSGKKSSETGERYLPKAARDALSPAEYAATSRKKREDTKKGKQHSKQPKKIARKVRKYRRVGKDEGGTITLRELLMQNFTRATPEQEMLEFKKDDFRSAESKLGEDSPNKQDMYYINPNKKLSEQQQKEIILGESLHRLKKVKPELYNNIYNKALADKDVSSWLKNSYNIVKKEQNEKRPYEQWVRSSRLDQLIGAYVLSGNQSSLPTLQDWDIDKLPYGSIRPDLENIKQQLATP